MTVDPGSTRRGGVLIRLLLALLLASIAHADGLTVDSLEPTALFARPAEGQPLHQRALLHLTNPGAPITAFVRVTLGQAAPETAEMGQVPTGESSWPIDILDTPTPTDAVVEVLDRGTGTALTSRRQAWQPQRKWRIFCVSYSHHDLGFGNYPHRVRTEIRHANIERPLRFCRETDGWDEDSKFRFVVETSEPITSFLGSHSEAETAELSRRIREGRIEIGGVHSTVSTEQLSPELLARLFYLSGRHVPDLLAVPAGRTGQIDDVLGLTWPLATFCAEAGVPYFFHGHNTCGDSLQPASAEPVFFWQGPGGDGAGRVLMSSRGYGAGWDQLGKGDEEAILRLVHEAEARHWPYDALLSQDGTDFTLVSLDNATKIREWNAKYAYPHLICATMDMFFDAIARQAKPGQIRTFAKDGNNEWADQDGTDAWLLGLARRQDEFIPTAEKFATIATSVAGGSYPWESIYQAYHRLLTYHEHSDGIYTINPDPEVMQQYETEQAENREMVVEAEGFATEAMEDALEKLSAQVTTTAERSIIVFNPLPHPRIDVVRIAPGELRLGLRLVDSGSGRVVEHQVMPDGAILFIARDVPATGYRCFNVLPATAPAKTAPDTKANVLENAFYRLQFNATTGAIVSLRDKQLGLELVDKSAPFGFNEYLYQHYEKHPEKGPTSYRVEAAQLSREDGPVACVMTVRSAPRGVKALTQTITLYRDIKRIDFALDMEKSPSGRNCRYPNYSLDNREAAYVALPFAVPEFRFHHELPGGVMEPIRDQFDGSCTTFYAVRHFADVSNDRFGITLSSPEAPLVEYGQTRPYAIYGVQESDPRMATRRLSSSAMYLYLLNNVGGVNIRWDQPGPLHFTWSIRSHEGDWRAGLADEFGWGIQNPLIAKTVQGKSQGSLPPVSSFVSVDVPNVVCTTLKPAEANGGGLILRFVETRGTATKATVSLPFLERIARAVETDLVENDRPLALRVSEGHKVTFSMAPFGVKTIRLLIASHHPAPNISSLKARAASDMQVRLSWASSADPLAHFLVYRGTTPGFTPSLLHLVARPVGRTYRDQPALHYGGWINNRLEPATTYFYRVAAVDRWNNEGPLSPAVRATTLRSSEANTAPLRVECLRAILISPLSPDNYVNLLFRTNCEPDVRKYEIHRSTRSDFVPDPSTRIGFADADAVVAGSKAYGHVPVDYRMGDYDHMMYQDRSVAPATEYFYRVCAVDTAGQRGPFSEVASVRTKAPPVPLAVTTSSSDYAPWYGSENAIDGVPFPESAWLSRAYGGGTAEAPSDAWWAVVFPHPLSLRGVNVVGDDRAEYIPLQRGLRVEYRVDGQWRTAAEVHDATERTLRVRWPVALGTDALRIYVPAEDLPRATVAGIPDGVVRVCELVLILDDGREVTVPELLGP